MLTWIIVFGILAVLGVASYYKGAIRSLISLVGLFCALFLVLPLSRPLKPLVPKVGLEHPIWSVLVPPLVVFVLIVLVFVGLGYFVHWKVALHYKYGTDDYTRIRFERLNRLLGLCVGLIGGAIYAILVGLVIYMFGYPAVQAVGDDSPMPLQLLGKVRQEMQESGADRTLAAIDLMPENYYLAADVLGLIYHNHAVHDRLSNYPPFLGMAERPEFQEIATDADLQGMLQTKASVIDIIKHPKVQAVVKNSEIMQELGQVDLKDLYQYLKTGKSAKYEDEKILGRWLLDTSATLTLEKKRNPDMTVKEMNQIKTLVTVFLSKVILTATPDNKVWVKQETTEEAKRIIEAAKAAAAPPPPPPEENAQPQMSALMMQRYGLRPGMRPAAPQQAPAPAPKPADTTPVVPNVNLSSQGTWQLEGTKYKLKLQIENAGQASADAALDGERLLVSVQGRSLVFTRLF